jgi:hypothetical protein
MMNKAAVSSASMVSVLSGYDWWKNSQLMSTSLFHCSHYRQLKGTITRSKTYSSFFCFLFSFSAFSLSLYYKKHIGIFSMLHTNLDWCIPSSLFQKNFEMLRKQRPKWFEQFFLLTIVLRWGTNQKPLNFFENFGQWVDQLSEVLGSDRYGLYSTISKEFGLISVCVCV